METWLFYLFAAASILSAANVLLQRRVFYAALSLIICLTSIAGIYMILQAPFIAAVQVIVYAGAIMVLFLFVIMLLDPYSTAALPDKRRLLRYVGVLLGALTLVLLYSMIRRHHPSAAPMFIAPDGGGAGTTEAVGRLLFRDYLLPFEVTSVLILVAIMGAVVLAKRKT